MKRAFLLVVVFTLLAAAVVGLGYFQFMVKPQMIKGFIAAAGKPVNSVAAVEAKEESWSERLTAIGSLRATKGVEISTQIAGVIRAIQFDSSQNVAKDAPLIELDDATEQADLKANMAALRNADATLKRQSTLVDRGSSAQALLDSSLAARDQASALQDRIRAIIAQKKIVAPFAGRLGIRKVDIGQYLSPGAPIVTLQQLDPMYVDFQAPEKYFSSLAAGQSIVLNVDAWAGETFKGKINLIDARVSTETRNFLVRAEVPNPGSRLAPGMFADVSVMIGAPKMLVTLPRTAVVYSLYGDVVFVVIKDPNLPADAPADSPKIVERRFVRVGEALDDRISILEGVQPGEMIVSQGQIKLQAGMPVRVDPKAGLPVRATMPKL